MSPALSSIRVPTPPSRTLRTQPRVGFLYVVRAEEWGTGARGRGGSGTGGGARPMQTSWVMGDPAGGAGGCVGRVKGARRGRGETAGRGPRETRAGEGGERGEGGGARARGLGGWTCVHAHLDLAFPLYSGTLRFSPFCSKCFSRLAFQICKTFRGTFPKSRAGRVGTIAGIRARRAAVASEGRRLAASTAGLVKVPGNFWNSSHGKFSGAAFRSAAPG